MPSAGRLVPPKALPRRHSQPSTAEAASCLCRCGSPTARKPPGSAPPGWSDAGWASSCPAWLPGGPRESDPTSPHRVGSLPWSTQAQSRHLSRGWCGSHYSSSFAKPASLPLLGRSPVASGRRSPWRASLRSCRQGGPGKTGNQRGRYSVMPSRSSVHPRAAYSGQPRHRPPERCPKHSPRVRRPTACDLAFPRPARGPADAFYAARLALPVVLAGDYCPSNQGWVGPLQSLPVRRFLACFIEPKHGVTGHTIAHQSCQPLEGFLSGPAGLNLVGNCVEALVGSYPELEKIFGQSFFDLGVHVGCYHHARRPGRLLGRSRVVGR